MRIYELDKYNTWTGASTPSTPKDPCPQGWVRSNENPPWEEGKVARWYRGEWSLIPKLTTDEPRGEPMPAVITVLQLRRLFTFEEKVACEEAILAGNSALKVFMDDLAVATEVDLSDPLVEQGLDILIASEIITEERKQQVLSNEAPE